MKAQASISDIFEIFFGISVLSLVGLVLIAEVISDSGLTGSVRSILNLVNPMLVLSLLAKIVFDTTTIKRERENEFGGGFR